MVGRDESWSYSRSGTRSKRSWSFGVVRAASEAVQRRYLSGSVLGVLVSHFCITYGLGALIPVRVDSGLFLLNENEIVLEEVS